MVLLSPSLTWKILTPWQPPFPQRPGCCGWRPPRTPWVILSTSRALSACAGRLKTHTWGGKPFQGLVFTASFHMFVFGAGFEGKSRLEKRYLQEKGKPPILRHTPDPLHGTRRHGTRRRRLHCNSACCWWWTTPGVDLACCSLRCKGQTL